ncbi:MAG: hypothetical protein ACR2JD_01935 [Nocardioides sp.]
MPARPPRHLTVAPTLALFLALGALSGCAPGKVAPSPPATARTALPPSVAAIPAREPAESTVKAKTVAGSVTGRIKRHKRTKVVKHVAGVVDAWLEKAYVGGTYPRTEFKKSYPGFTQGATRTARGDRELMSNADIGNRIDGVRVRRRTIVVDLLAVSGTARAATARVHLAFKTSGVEPFDKLRTVRRVAVTGRVFLVQKDGRWRIFGYDVAKARA